jgi:hypothetical protein
MAGSSGIGNTQTVRASQKTEFGQNGEPASATLGDEDPGMILTCEIEPSIPTHIVL